MSNDKRLSQKPTLLKVSIKWVKDNKIIRAKLIGNEGTKPTNLLTIVAQIVLK